MIVFIFHALKYIIHKFRCEEIVKFITSCRILWFYTINYFSLSFTEPICALKVIKCKTFILVIHISCCHQRKHQTPRHLLLWGETTGDKGTVTRKCFHFMTSSCIFFHGCGPSYSVGSISIPVMASFVFCFISIVHSTTCAINNTHCGSRVV